MRKLLRVLIALVGVGIGCGIVALILFTVRFPGYDYVMQYTTDSIALIAIYVVVGFLFGLISFIFSPAIIDGIGAFFRKIETRLTEMPALDILFGVLGLMLGLVLAFLLSLIIGMIELPVLPQILTLIAYVVCGYYGAYIGVTRRAELVEGTARRGQQKGALDGASPKVLDTSVIIDGRIFDICKTGFLEGCMVIPAFVLKELRHIADSADAMKRSRGRRGLDIIKSMQEELQQTVVIEERDYDDVDEVDVKLLRLALDMDGVLVTNDYNLNKVAAVQNMRVLNINDLANVVKPILLPGEEIQLAIVREGKETGQGVGYLDDGTMVIVENGKKHIGDTCELVVTSALQTSAGRMIFAKLKN